MLLLLLALISLGEVDTVRLTLPLHSILMFRLPRIITTDVKV